MQARFTLPSGEKLALSGFLAVDRKRLKALPAEKLHALAVSDELELIYLHLQSLRNFNAVKDRLRVGGATSAGDQSPGSEPTSQAADQGGTSGKAEKAEKAEQAEKAEKARKADKDDAAAGKNNASADAGAKLN